MVKPGAGGFAGAIGICRPHKGLLPRAIMTPLDNPTPTTRYDDQPTLGDIKINHTVVAGIVRLATLRVPGVAGVGGGIVDGISELFAKREADHRGVKVTEDAEDNYYIEIRLVVTFGAEIGKTAYEVQIAVAKQVSAMTGKPVRKVDVIIEGVRLPVGQTEQGRDEDDAWPEAPATD
jgi:uncharacterized alkaline shock family protein YloU